MKGAPRAPTLGDREGCATGPYGTTITLGHVTKAGSHSTSTYYIETNREAAKMRRQRNMAQMKERNQNSRKRTKREREEIYEMQSSKHCSSVLDAQGT